MAMLEQLDQGPGQYVFFALEVFIKSSLRSSFLLPKIRKTTIFDSFIMIYKQAMFIHFLYQISRGMQTVIPCNLHPSGPNMTTFWDDVLDA